MLYSTQLQFKLKFELSLAKIGKLENIQHKGNKGNIGKKGIQGIQGKEGIQGKRGESNYRGKKGTYGKQEILAIYVMQIILEC